jgi:methionine-rich copper-binding protein CopC
MFRRFVRSLLILLAGGVLLVGSSAPALAHANLVSCSIKNHEVFHVGHVPTKITGDFAQDLDPAHSWMAVFEGVADHGLVTEHEHSVVSFTHEKVMTLKLPKLQPEPYYMIWYTHSAVDGHYAAGIVYFTVKK